VSEYGRHLSQHGALFELFGVQQDFLLFALNPGCKTTISWTRLLSITGTGVTSARKNLAIPAKKSSCRLERK